jgi:hypothetical protein
MPYRAYFYAFKQNVEEKVLAAYANHGKYKSMFSALWLYWYTHIAPLCERYFASWPNRNEAQLLHATLMKRLNAMSPASLVHTFTRQILAQFEETIRLMMRQRFIITHQSPAIKSPRPSV